MLLILEENTHFHRIFRVCLCSIKTKQKQHHFFKWLFNAFLTVGFFVVVVVLFSNHFTDEITKIRDDIKMTA